MEIKPLLIVPDSETMTPELFKNMMKRFRYHKNVHYNFSKKHSEDILLFRKKLGLSTSTITSNTYSLPITYNTDQTTVI
jgi:hypothetical protein